MTKKARRFSGRDENCAISKPISTTFWANWAILSKLTNLEQITCGKPLLVSLHSFTCFSLFAPKGFLNLREDVINRWTAAFYKLLSWVELSLYTNRLFMYQCENENEPEDESFRSFWIKPVTNEPSPQYYDTLKDRFVRHALPPERTKALVFVFVSFSSWYMNRLYTNLNYKFSSLWGKVEGHNT